MGNYKEGEEWVGLITDVTYYMCLATSQIWSGGSMLEPINPLIGDSAVKS